MIGVAWLLPAALAGLVLIGVPIAIHLLVRQQSLRVPFPSLRFLKESRMAAFRRRTIQDVALLICRVAMVSAAVLALASPVFQTPSRQTAYNARIARAIVVPPGDDVSATRDLEEGVMAAQVFSRAALADAMADASQWLASQPPSRREIVIVSPLRAGQLAEGDLSATGAGVGLRFVRVPAPTQRVVEFPVLTLDGDEAVIVKRTVRLEPDATTVIREGVVETLPAAPISVIAPEADRGVADVVLRAVLEAGVRWPVATKPVSVRWRGPVLASSATTLKQAIDAAVAAPTLSLEPNVVSDADLARWTRSAAPPDPGAPPADEGDRRWLWALALVLLAAEWMLRRSPAHEIETETMVEEARVA